MGEDTFGLPPWLVLDGYSSSIPDQTELKEMADRNLRVLRLAAPVGNALLYRHDRLEVVAECAKNQTTRVSVCVQGRAGGPLAELGPTVVVSCHLDATSEDKRVKGIIKVLQMVSAPSATCQHRELRWPLNGWFSFGRRCERWAPERQSLWVT